MKRISLILASFVLLSGGKASAFVGGPFDNGDFSSLLDNSGVYQVAFRFSNGSGFASFGNNVDTELFLPTTGGTAVAPASTFSVLNRSVFYYKGVTYMGTCTGMVDHERKIVSGVTNGNSDITTSQTTTTGGTQTASTNSLVFSGLFFPANSEFRCKITNSHPILKFHGTGELSIINPSTTAVALQAISTIILSNPDTTDNIGEQLDDLLTALTNNAPALAAAIPSAESTFQNSDRVKMKVFGSRIWHVSRR
jgi:hypothetical protein